ncbi:MAG: twin-arginine translocase subunit TatC [Actinomycetota bacterium]
MTATEGSKRDDERPKKQKKEEEGRMSLVEHLTELRTRIIRSVIAIAIGAIIGWFLYIPVLDFILEPYCETLDQACADGQATLRIDEPLEGLSTRMTVAGYIGIMLAVPVWLWQAWRFISPGLYPHERRHGVTFVGLGVLLFAAGASLAYWTLPRALEFLTEIGGEDLVTEFRARAYIEFIIKMMLAFGLGFEFPLVLVFLQILGVVNHQALARQRRLALVGIVILVAVITPSGDPISLVALAGPMYLFYEGAIIFGKLRNRRRAKANA